MSFYLTYLCPIVLLLATIEGSDFIVEKGHSIQLQCNLSNQATNVTWFVKRNDFIKISSCSVANNCTDVEPSLYQGKILKSNGNNVTVLTIPSVRRQEDSFRCVSDDGLNKSIILEVYAWPKKPVCSHSVSDALQISCTTANVFPVAFAAIYRREGNVKLRDFRVDNLDSYGSEGDFNASWVWYISLTNLSAVSTYFVEVKGFVTKYNLISNTPVSSDDISVSIKFSATEVQIDDSKCPVGYGVRGKYIPSDTYATCKCVVKSPGIPPGFAQWYTNDNLQVGQENVNDGSSTLTLKSNYDRNKTFHCRPVNARFTNVTDIIYEPQFTSPAVNSGTFGLQSPFIVLGAVCAWLLSHLPNKD